MVLLGPAEQLLGGRPHAALPGATLGGGGGRVTTDHVTQHLVTVADVVSRFGIAATTWGRVGGPGGLEVAAH
jgi:hypothetical protein